jgi:hypothetical protein
VKGLATWLVAGVIVVTGSVVHGRTADAVTAPAFPSSPVQAAPPAGSVSDGAAASAATAGIDDALEVIRGRLDPPLGDADREETVELFLSGSWRLRDGTVVDLTDGVPWDGRSTMTTSQLRLLHSLLIVHDLVEGGPVGIEAALRLVEAWDAANPRGAAATRMAWHDETTARRTTALVRLHDALCRAPDGDGDGTRRAWIQLLIEQHLALLLDDGFHATGTNHGMFQDRAALVASAYLAIRTGESEASQAAWSTARDRLVDYYRATVRDEGVHLEHAPAYHQVIAASARRDGAFLAAFGDHGAARTLADAHTRMRRYATHVIQPDGTWPLVSDTFPTQGPQRSLWDDPGYRYAASRGAEGRPPAARAVAFEDAGYVIMRDRWTGDGEATYLHFTAAYHSDYHKHADDLSVWLYHDGPLLTELGPQGYAMDDPLVRCAYSAAAHNIVTVDGAELPRVDDRVGRTRLVAVDLDSDVWTATGVNERLDGIVLERRVSYDPAGGLLEVTDRVRTPQRRALRLRWHLDPSVTVSGGAGDTVTLARPDREPVRASFRSDTPFDLEVLGPDAGSCAGLRFGGEEAMVTSTLELRTAPVRAIELVSRFELPRAAAPPPR